ncbi:hypothetical protein C7972_12066 [Arenibacter sp. ARW7G5Y1]|nr:hypothetical protein C7972_12066 [Arenibacter sp. ARW7G5Y1]
MFFSIIRLSNTNAPQTIDYRYAINKDYTNLLVLPSSMKGNLIYKNCRNWL